MNFLLLALSVCLPSVGEVRLDCPDPGTWDFSMAKDCSRSGEETVRITLRSPSQAVPPRFSVGWFVSQRGIHHVWTSESVHYGIPWSAPMVSELTANMPVYAMLDVDDRSRFACACSESCRRVVFQSPINEVKKGFDCVWTFFSVPEAPTNAYEVVLRFDSRNIEYEKAIADGVSWVCQTARIEPMVSPDDAYDALYSTWYGFHQEVTAQDVERECRIAVDMGMRTVIVDDGWQIDRPPDAPPLGGYHFCGDWRPGCKFPNMAEHVRRVQAMGFKYMLWYSVPFVGDKSVNFSRFKGKCLPVENSGGHVLDPRFPEVREFVIGTYERAVREWNIDGFKLDFIGRFTLKNGVVDPAIAENYAGRDIKSIPLAVEAMLTEAMRRLKALKPDILIEFRQPYISPSIRRFGNMIRANDCPLSMVENRTRIARLRLTSGKTAVHADMLQWRNDEPVERAALNILNSIFGVVQYSVRIAELPEDHVRMMRHWIQFAAQHGDALLKGEFHPHFPASDYPLLEGVSANERVFGVYQEGLAVRIGALDRPTFVLNGTASGTVVIDLPCEARAICYDAFGSVVCRQTVGKGLSRLAVPPAGYVCFDFKETLK